MLLRRCNSVKTRTLPGAEVGPKCTSVETARPRDRTIGPGIVMPERYESSQRVDYMARVVISFILLFREIIFLPNTVHHISIS